MAGKKDGKPKLNESENGSGTFSNIKHSDFNRLPVDDEALQKTVAFFEDCLDEVFSSREDFYVATLGQKLRVGMSQSSGAKESAASDAAWIGIESLSRLRAVVGGRFQNIKQRWVDAGLPLKEHRGERTESFTLDQEGWVTLSSWIASQGFEIRLTPDRRDQVFEIRPVSDGKPKSSQI